ncbi:dockerin type I domain-containing protein [Paenibacillus hexagrammi]|uniref:Dockerin type I domain-containing protein n=1 Tax=Paenibacillus hexagrammi TaxID=2908839 RepID=A0ABY3SNW4_9BACL|nr:dockerin type I domain-containing protein [Paenibacillus sp. YPD9-1]UJF35707.1 dockerin type I domain-containing protein [Paenibacillus sp. YPD9-1]
MRAKAPSSAVVRLSGIVAANGDGVESTLQGGSCSVIVTQVDKTALNALIIEAQDKHDAAVEGNQAGQYPAGAKANLQSAIDQARVVANDARADDSQVAAAVTNLNAALQAFVASVIQQAPGDVNGDHTYSIGDLALVASYYGKTSTDPDWSTVKKADIVEDGKIDIADLAAVARKILESE